VECVHINRFMQQQVLTHCPGRAGRAKFRLHWASDRPISRVAHAVQLCFADKTVGEDIGKDGVVFSYVERTVLRPAEVSILDDGGRQLSKCSEFEVFSQQAEDSTTLEITAQDPTRGSGTPRLLAALRIWTVEQLQGL
jgi:hypothetical protein